MNPIRCSLCVAVTLSLFSTSALAQTIVINDSTTTVNLPPGLVAGGTVSFEGNIDVAGDIAIDFHAVPLNAKLIFTAPSTTNSDSDEALIVSGAFEGSVENFGSLSSEGSDTVRFDDTFDGEFLNAGSIGSDVSQGVLFSGDFAGDFTNRGTITAEFEAIDFEGDFTGNFTNTNLLESLGGDGLDFDGDFDGNFLNSGTITSIDEGVEFDGVFEGTFTNHGVIDAGDEGIYFDDYFTGDFINGGTIKSADSYGVYFYYDIEGDFTNSGAINAASDAFYLDEGMVGNFTNTGNLISNDGYGVYISGDFEGDFTNSGLIRSDDEGVYISGDFNGNFSNTGTIAADSGAGIHIDTYFNGNFTNSGTIKSEDSDGVYFYFEIGGNFTNSGQIIGENYAFYLDEEMVGDFTNSGLLKSRVENAVEMDGYFEGNFTNTGTIDGGEQGVYIDGSFTGQFLNSGTIIARDGDGLDVNDEFTGSFLNSGTIIARDVGGSEAGDGVDIEGTFTGTAVNEGRIEADDDGLEFDDFEGTFLNSGTIIAGEDSIEFRDLTGTLTNTGEIKADDDGIDVRSIEGGFLNTGVISSGEDGLDVQDRFSGTFLNKGTLSGNDSGAEFDEFNGSFTNRGVIEGRDDFGISASSTGSTFTNENGRISGGEASISLGDGNGTVVLKGASRIDGIMRGGDGNDVLRLEDIRGVSAEKRDELIALAATDNPGQNTVTLFGETLQWTEFEDFQVDANSLVSYETLITRPGLEGFGSSLDNVLSLTDEGRDFLTALGELNGVALNDAAANLAGQTLIDGLGDFVQNQGSQLASLFGGQFSSRRSSGGSGSVASSGERSGLFTREVQVGVTIEAPAETKETFVAGYYGNSEQDANGLRSGMSADSASVIFGVTQETRPGLDLGLWGGYTDNRATVDGFGSYLRNEAGLFGMHAQVNNEFYFANLVLGYGFHDQLSTRRDFAGNQFDGDAIGHQALLNAQIGKIFSFGSENRGSVSPYLGAAASSLWMGGFDETSPSASRLRFHAEDTVSAQGIVGVTLEGYQETRKGWIRPRLDLSWWHEFADANSYGVSLATPGFLNAFQVTSPVANRDRAVVQAGMEFAFDQWQNVSFEANYFGTFGSDDYASHGGAFSAIFEF